MTLTIKEPLEITVPGNAGSPTQNSQNLSNSSPRSNPVCLEVPVVLRSLPGQQGSAPGAPGPIRVEGKTVIVFDNGAVLRISNPFAPGETVILSNQQGQEVKCEIAVGRNLPNKGYIEVEFMNQVADYWHIHQTSEPGSAPVSLGPATALQQPAPIELPPIKNVTSRAAAPAKESEVSFGSAPTFDDIAGLVRMSPPNLPDVKSPDAKSNDRKIESSPYSSTLKSKNELVGRLSEPVKLASVTRAVSPVSEPYVEKQALSSDRESASVPGRMTNLSNDFMGKGTLTSAYSATASSPAEPRGRLMMILGGAALVLAGFGAGFFFMHSGSAPTTSPTATLSQSSAPVLPPANSAPVASSMPAGEQESLLTTKTNSTPELVSTEVISAAPVDSQDLRRQANAAEAKQTDPSVAHRQTIANLKMSSPIAPKQNAVRVAEGYPLGAADITSTVATGGSAANAMLPSVMRAENQPAPPPSSTRNIREPKLVSSTHPAYPPLAKQSNVQGSVTIAASVDANGNVVETRAVSGPALLRPAALEAVRHWKYSPAMIDGKPAASQVTVNLDFRLN